MLKLITLLFTSSMTVMAGATISPALPQIQQFFQNEPNSEFWVKLMLTLPGLFTAIGAPFAGIIIDRFSWRVGVHPQFFDWLVDWTGIFRSSCRRNYDNFYCFNC